MLVKDLITLDVSANDLLTIVKLPVTKRMIRKARRNLGDARMKVRWYHDIELTSEQEVLLERAMEKHRLRLRIREESVEYEKVVRILRQSLECERVALSNFINALVRYRKCVTQMHDIEIRIEVERERLPEDDTRILQWRAMLQELNLYLADVTGTLMVAKRMVSTVELQNKSLSRRISQLGRKLPVDLMNVMQSVVRLRKKVCKEERT